MLSDKKAVKVQAKFSSKNTGRSDTEGKQTVHESLYTGVTKMFWQVTGSRAGFKYAGTGAQVKPLRQLTRCEAKLTLIRT